MTPAPGSSGSIPSKTFDRVAEGANPDAENEGAAATAEVALRVLAGAPEVQQEGGAGREPVNRDLSGVLFWAVTRGHAEDVRALLEGGADPNAVDEGGDTALQRATTLGYAAVVRALLEWGADPNAVDEGGDTALIVAALKGHASVARILLTAGANPNALRQNGDTALQRATTLGYAAVVRALLEWGANPQITDRYGRTVIQKVEGAKSKTLRQIHGLLLRADERNKERDVAELFATLMTGKGISMLH